MRLRAASSMTDGSSGRDGERRRMEEGEARDTSPPVASTWTTFGGGRPQRASAAELRLALEPSELLRVADRVDPADPAVLDRDADRGLDRALALDAPARAAVEPGRLDDHVRCDRAEPQQH